MYTTPKAIVTIPPYAPFIREVLAHNSVEGIRLNTVMPTKGKLEDLLKKLNDDASTFGKDLWIDLKCRQLRVKSFGTPPYTAIDLSHNISLDTSVPVTAYFSNGEQTAKILAVEDNRLIMLDGPRRVVGPGEAVNIIHPSLSIEGFLTDTDKKYIEASQKLGMHNYMLSFVEKSEDITGLLKYDNKAKIVAKIESEKGLNFVNNDYKEHCGSVGLMAARGDLYIEVLRPHKIIDAVENIVRKDNNAIVASRIFPSLALSPEPSCEDIGDVDNLLRMGYRRVMFGDDICMKRESIIGGLNLYSFMAEKYRTDVDKK